MSLPQPSNTKHLSHVINAANSNLRTVTFNPSNELHLEAFQMLVYQGRQHPTLRFQIEHPYIDIRAMMTDKIVRAYIDDRMPHKRQ